MNEQERRKEFEDYMADMGKLLRANPRLPTCAVLGHEFIVVPRLDDLNQVREVCRYCGESR
jgi:hypothetical protein